MRLLAIALTCLLLAVQWPLWFGKGGWLRVRELQQQLEAQRRANDENSVANKTLAAELRSLKEGREAVEERARLQLNMIRGDEVFFQLVPEKNAAQPKR